MKTLHMIGFSHIDLVWFWTREEGLQEARATFSSALDRLHEFPDFRFTCTTAALFDFIQRQDPQLFERLKEQVALGRIELTGGWWIEPDCNLPHGEALLRQGLYGQEFFLKAFGRRARIGGNVDTFGHGPVLPQLLRGCGMDRYYFMRPRLPLRKDSLGEAAVPLVSWQSADGSAVAALNLPGEYTVWFEENLRDNIQASLNHLDAYPALPVFFGVGNHGGGPTVQNIRSVERLKGDFPQVKLEFSTLAGFFEELGDTRLPALEAVLEGVNTGCYSVDHKLKYAMRKAEQALLRAERLNGLAVLMGSPETRNAETYAGLWKRLLFCQFHDTLGGTSIKEGRDNAEHDLLGVLAQAEDLAHSALTSLSSLVDTRGEGQPILLVNDSAQPYTGLVDLELPWFCKDPLALTDEEGRELPCQIAKTACTMRWYRLGGRRRLLFSASLPAFGYALYRAHIREPRSLHTGIPEEGAPLLLENEHLLAEFDREGQLTRLVDKKNGFMPLKGGPAFEIWQDQRDSWGHGKEGRLYQRSDEAFETQEARLVEQGPLRSSLLVRQQNSVCRLTLRYSLDQGASALKLKVNALWDGPWKALKLRFPFNEPLEDSLAEGAYAAIRRPVSGTEYYMHRYVDARQANGAGLAVVNDGIYGFSLGEDHLLINLLRSAIFAHGECVGWENPHDVYEYNDIGSHEYTFLLQPHGKPLEEGQLESLADSLHAPPLALMDYQRPGPLQHTHFSALDLRPNNLRLVTLKPAQDGKGQVLRLFESGGQACEGSLRLGNRTHPLRFLPHEIKTLRVRGQDILEQNMLEETP